MSSKRIRLQLIAVAGGAVLAIMVAVITGCGPGDDQAFSTTNATPSASSTAVPERP